MKCAECMEELAAYFEGALDRATREAVKAHLDLCPACRAEAEAIAGLRARLETNGKRFTGGSLSAVVMDKMARLQTTKVRRHGMLWRYKGRFTVAAAAAILLTAVLALTTLNRTGNSAYAVEQTAEATKGLRYVHTVELISWTNLAGQMQNTHRETWAQFGDDGKLLSLRMDQLLTEDGRKVVVWQANKAQVWFVDKQGALTVTDSSLAAAFAQLSQDPQSAVDDLRKAQAAGKLKIEEGGPESGWPIRLTVTRGDAPDAKRVYFVDPKTKLVRQVDSYSLENGQYRLASSTVYLDYNSPIDPKMFVLDLPAGVTKIDHTTQTIGMAKGALSDKEIVAKIAKEFFEALIAKDYAKAGQLYSGTPAERMEKFYKDITFVRIVSLGEPVPQPIPGVGGLVVTCEVEVERDGKKTVMTFKPAVRPVGNDQPDRWEIHGGV